MSFPKYRQLGAYHWQAYQTDRHYRRHVDRVVAWIPEREGLLDVGAGDGLIASKLGCRGIDADSLAVQLAQERGVDVRQGSVYDLAGRYNAVFLGDVLEHLERPGEAVSRLADVTRKLYVATPPRTGDLREYHVCEWTPDELVDWMAEYGWQVSGPVEIANERMYAAFVRNRGLVYTAVIGQPDVVLSPQDIGTVDALCYTNLPQLPCGDYRRIAADPAIGLPWLGQRKVKLDWPDVFDRFDWSVYVDSNLRLLVPPSECLSYLEDAGIAMMRHPFLSCVYHEGNRARKSGLADNWVDIRNACQDAGIGRRFGMWAGGFIVRRHTQDVLDFSKAWWIETLKWQCRDQLSLPIVVKQTGLRPATIDLDLRDNPLVEWRQHEHP